MSAAVNIVVWAFAAVIVGLPTLWYGYNQAASGDSPDDTLPPTSASGMENESTPARLPPLETESRAAPPPEPRKLPADERRGSDRGDDGDEDDDEDDEGEGRRGKGDRGDDDDDDD